MSDSVRKTVAVVGGGISGLCAAFWIQKAGFEVIVFEPDREAGGTMKTQRESGWLVETGPNSALDTTPLLRQLFDELGIGGEVMYANESSNKRYILRGGSLRQLPTGVGSFLGSRLWSWPGKLRLLREPFAGRAGSDESVADFVERRLGREFLDYAINPFVAGVYAGDPRQLSVRAAFPKLWALEDKYGGLLRGALMSRKERRQRKEVAKDRARMFSFGDGMQTLPRALSARLGKSVRTGCSVEQIIPMRAGKFPVYTLYYSENGVRAQTQADAVVLAAPAFATASIIRPIDPETATILESIYYPPVAEVFLGFEKKHVGHNLDGFGFLVPEVERMSMLGTIWSSSLFPNRAPEGCVALTSFVGGARNAGLMKNDDEQMTSLVLGELKAILGIKGKPVFTKIIRWEKAIPQYNLGYDRILATIDRFEQNFQRAYICSNYRGGIAVGDCVMSAERVSKEIASSPTRG